MKVTITESKKNELLKRTEMTGTVTFTGATPRRAEVKKAVAAAAKCNAEFLVIKKIDSHYGGETATVTATAYETKDLFDKVEREYMRTRNTNVKKAAEEKPEVKEETPADTPAEGILEAPKEEGTPKEDTPAEKDTPKESKEEVKKEADHATPEKKDDAPAEESKEGVPTKEAAQEDTPEEDKEVVPATPEKKEDAPAEEKKEEADPKHTPKEEAKPEEKKEEVTPGKAPEKKEGD